MEESRDTQRSAERIATEVARATALHHLALSQAHALNNAFTAVLGEASFLQDVRKSDPEVDEACCAIRDGVERCARMTRALLARRAPVSDEDREIDLVGVVRDVGRVLGDALSRRFDLQVEAPDDLLLARGTPAAVESLLLLLVQHAEALSPGPASLVLRALRRDPDDTVLFEVQIRGASLQPGCEHSLLESDGGQHGMSLARFALHGVADSQRARLEAERQGDVLRLRAVFAAVDDSG